MPTRSEVLDVITQILESTRATVPDDADLDDLGWDSLSDLNLISIADERFGVALDPQALRSCETPQDLVALFPAS